MFTSRGHSGSDIGSMGQADRVLYCQDVEKEMLVPSKSVERKLEGGANNLRELLYKYRQCRVI